MRLSLPPAPKKLVGFASSVTQDDEVEGRQSNPLKSAVTIRSEYCD
jgi:hypothetical protein